jgi:hypothetical protein
MKGKILIVGAVLITLAIIVGGVLLVVKSGPSQLTVTQEVEVEVPETSYDWGEIGINDGIVQKTFLIKNSGSAPLQLNNVVTSCMCTTATLSIDGQVSPAFGMHAKSGWLGTVAPGEAAALVVEFDPAFHGPSGVGVISRQITLNTNDSNQPQLTFNLTAKVI